MIITTSLRLIAITIYSFVTLIRVSCNIITNPQLCDKDVKQYAGHIELAKVGSAFFWLFESRRSPDSDPLILWLNGGPGISAMMGVFTGVGPCSLVDPEQPNPHSWNREANLLFLDQPIGTGFSSGTHLANNTAEAADQIEQFLEKFFIEFPRFRKSKLHIFGSSYAGRTIPKLAYNLLSAEDESGDLIYNLESIGLGNPTLDIMDHFRSYPQFACLNGDYTANLSKDHCDDMLSAVPYCRKKISRVKFSETSVSTNFAWADYYCRREVRDVYNHGGRNLYDMRLTNHSNIYSENLSKINQYFNRPSIQQALLSKAQPFTMDNEQVYTNFLRSGDMYRNFKSELSVVLSCEVKVLVFVGDADFLNNWLGTQISLFDLDWAGAESFITQKEVPMVRKDEKQASKSPPQQLGIVRAHNELTFVRIFNASHTVTMDNSELAFNLVNHWIHGKPVENLIFLNDPPISITPTKSKPPAAQSLPNPSGPSASETKKTNQQVPPKDTTRTPEPEAKAVSPSDAKKSAPPVSAEKGVQSPGPKVQLKAATGSASGETKGTPVVTQKISDKVSDPKVQSPPALAQDWVVPEDKKILKPAPDVKKMPTLPPPKVHLGTSTPASEVKNDEPSVPKDVPKNSAPTSEEKRNASSSSPPQDVQLKSTPDNQADKGKPSPAPAPVPPSKQQPDTPQAVEQKSVVLIEKLLPQPLVVDKAHQPKYLPKHSVEYFPTTVGHGPP